MWNITAGKYSKRSKPRKFEGVRYVGLKLTRPHQTWGFLLCYLGREVTAMVGTDVWQRPARSSTQPSGPSRNKPGSATPRKRPMYHPSQDRRDPPRIYRAGA